MTRSCRDIVELEAQAVPGMLMCSQPFAPLAENVASSLGLPDVRMVVVAHPFGSVPEEDLVRRGVPDEALAEVLRIAGDE